jgi:hypothetical protein
MRWSDNMHRIGLLMKLFLVAVGVGSGVGSLVSLMDGLVNPAIFCMFILYSTLFIYSRRKYIYSSLQNMYSHLRKKYISN